MTLYQFFRRQYYKLKSYFWEDSIDLPPQLIAPLEDAPEEEKAIEEPPTKSFPWKMAFDLIKDYFLHAENKWLAWLLLIGVIVCVVGIVALTASLSWWFAGFWALITAKAALTPILVSLGYFTLQIAGMVTAYVLKNYLMGQLSILWRDWLTDKLIKQLFNSKNNYLDLHRFSKKIENIAQRIQEDVNNFVQLTLNLGADFLKSTLSLGTFVGSLWIVGGALSFVLLGLNIVIPGYLVWVALIIAVAATLITYFIGRSLAETNKNKERAEAEFREELSVLMNESESIAVENAGNFHETILEEKRAGIKKSSNEKLITETKLNAFQNFYNNIAGILPTLLALPLYFVGGIDLGTLMQVGMSFGEVNGAFSWFANTFQNLSAYQTSIERIVEMQEAFAEQGLDASLKDIEQCENVGKKSIKLEKLTIMKPQADSTDVIMRDLSLKFKKGEHVLIKGENGTGKSTIFKVIRGTWQHGNGKVNVPTGERWCFLPQTPNLPKNMTLKGLIAFPKSEGDYTDEEYLNAFNAIKDAAGMNKFDLNSKGKKNWGSFLSGGQKQLISIARAIIQKPDRVFLDESTSAMDKKTEEKAYQALRDKLPETTLVSIAHRSSVKKYHDRLVHFGRNDKDETVILKDKPIILKDERQYDYEPLNVLMDSI